ncbi:hypothetical protein H4R18_004139 [Coemansia javaensis]|uniref:Queuine tRNA-ribosyltransferase accessory subunit 2 n=1 Tax=Coemansia javaensis TaxID=2761396 RepID=A0A9W8H9Y0_9FUNG|nr:hypothetical protein H4R18_004139 [Coemansia javaensis]
MTAARFEVVSGGGDGARRGVLTLERTGARVETPAFMGYTRHGLHPHLVPDVAAEVGGLPAVTRVQAEDFLGGGRWLGGGGGVRALAGLAAGGVVVLDVLDPTVAGRAGRAGAKAMAIEAAGGTVRLGPGDFAALAAALQPDVVVPPADYVAEALPSLERGKRIEKSVERSARWLDEYLAQARHPAAVLAPVMGAHSAALRERSARALGARRGLLGYAFNDGGLALPLERRLDLARQSLAHLDGGGLRYMAGAAAPDAALRAVLAGMDLVDSSYAYAVTEQGFASTYALACDSPAARLDLWHESMRADFRPLAAGCACFACARHHRAYIHHLLATREMLATVLLQAHNLHVYARFFADVRRSLAAGTLPADAARFAAHYGPDAFDELRLLAAQQATATPTTKVQRRRHTSGPGDIRDHPPSKTTAPTAEPKPKSSATTTTSAGGGGDSRSGGD